MRTIAIALSTERGRAFLLQIGLQTLGKGASVFTCVRDKNTYWFRQWHRRKDKL